MCNICARSLPLPRARLCSGSVVPQVGGIGCRQYQREESTTPPSRLPDQVHTRLMEQGHDMRTVPELPGHSDVRTTMIYTHVLTEEGLAVRSLLDEPHVPL